MKVVQFLLVLLVSMLSACATENLCLKIPPSDARIECINKERAAVAAFEKERQKEQSQSKVKGRGDAKVNDLCFTRKATGEVVCSN
ncbi:hypothetical protein [Leptothrix ochracea]|uniref:hypothetical protein n=1 Tax=Leptothrix ochracea TaxID=735331 RepID=UPI0034E2598C